MNVVVLIDGREAIPVRAIPLLTYWGIMSPDEIARAFAGEESMYCFEGLSSFHREDAVTKTIPSLWWENFALRSLQAISEHLSAEEDGMAITREMGYQRWRIEALSCLPAGVFVWKDEYVKCYRRQYSHEDLSMFKDGKQLSRTEAERRVSLDFDPFIADPRIRELLMEGVDAQPATVDRKGAEENQALARTAAQDMAVLKAIKCAGFDPKKLPKSQVGKKGPKALVRSKLGTTGMWSGSRVFDKAWERLRSNGDIAD